MKTRETSVLDKFRNPRLVLAASALSMLALTACSSEADKPATSPVAVSTPDASPSPKAPIDIPEIDTSISGIDNPAEAVSMLKAWGDSLGNEFYAYNPNLMIDASGATGNEAQVAALQAMAERLHLTPKEINVGSQLLAHQVEQIKPFAEKLKAEEEAVGFSDAPWTAYKQYEATRAWLKIMGDINNGIADGSITYPETQDDCSFTEVDSYIRVQSSAGEIPQAILFPPYGQYNTVSKEMLVCDNKESTVLGYAKLAKQLYQSAIDYAVEKNAPQQAKALEILRQPVMGNDAKTIELIYSLRS